MCQKHNATKRFFLVVNHPPPLQKPFVLGLVKATPFTQGLFEKCRNTVYLERKEVEAMGLVPPRANHSFMLPVDVPRDWFLH